MTTRTDRAAAGFVTSIFQFSAVSLLQIAQVPVIIHYAGQETLGAYAAFAQMLLLLNLMDAGFGLAASRFLARAFGYDDGGKSFANVLATARGFYAYINALYGVLALLLVPYVPRLLSLHDALARQASLALSAIGIWAIARIPLIGYQFAMVGSQQLATYNLLLTVGNASRIVFSIGFVAAGGGLLGIVAANIAGEAIAVVLIRSAYLRSANSLGIASGPPNAQVLKEIFSFSRHAVFLNVAYYVTYYSDSLLAASMYGPIVAARYYATVMPAQQAWMLIMRLMNSSVPALNELLARNDWDSIRGAYFRIARYSLLLGGCLSLGIVGFNRVVISRWAGPSAYAGETITLLLALYAPFCILANVQTQFLFAIGRAKFLSKMCLVEGCLKLVFSVALGRLLGPVGVLLGTLVSGIIIWPWTWRACLSAIGVNPGELIKQSVLPVLAGSAPLALLIVPWTVMRPVSLAALAPALILFGVVWCSSTWFASLSQDDRLYVREIASRFRLVPIAVARGQSEPHQG